MSLATVKALKLHLDDRGYLYEMLRSDDPFFKGFGQAYVSSINPGVVKGFHSHKVQTDHVVCVAGQIKLVLIKDLGPDPNWVPPRTLPSNPMFSNRRHSYISEEYHLSPLDPKLVVIPPDIFHGWMCIGNEPATVVNFSTHPHDRDNPDEVRVDPHCNNWWYVWGVKDR